MLRCGRSTLTRRRADPRLPSRREGRNTQRSSSQRLDRPRSFRDDIQRNPSEQRPFSALGSAGGAGLLGHKWKVIWRISSLSGICARACFPRIAPATWANEVPLETVANRSVRWRVDQTWTRHARSRGQRRSASRTLAGKETPTGCPRQASPAWQSPCLGGALAGSGPETSPYVGAVPGHRHGYPSALRVETTRTITGLVPSGRGRLRRSGPPRPGPDRPTGHGKADQAWRRDHLLLQSVGSRAASTQRSQGCRRFSLLEVSQS